MPILSVMINIAISNIRETTHIPSAGGKYLKDFAILCDEKH